MSDDVKIKAENLTLKTCLLQAQNACMHLEKKLAEANAEIEKLKLKMREIYE